MPTRSAFVVPTVAHGMMEVGEGRGFQDRLRGMEASAKQVRFGRSKTE